MHAFLERFDIFDNNKNRQYYSFKKEIWGFTKSSCPPYSAQDKGVRQFLCFNVAEPYFSNNNQSDSIHSSCDVRIWELNTYLWVRGIGAKTMVARQPCYLESFHASWGRVSEGGFTLLSNLFPSLFLYDDVLRYGRLSSPPFRCSHPRFFAESNLSSRTLL